ncbi:MAG TPA: hypothetical protein VLA13_10285 [Massilibacterium sp.]|nr:hypothetical protein [Massilibacterium sp.]
MPIKNYSSSVKPTDSLGKIQGLLAEHGSSQISMDYENGKPVAMTFRMWINDVLVPFRLTVDVDGMLRAMKKDKKVPNSACTYEQAERTAWKNKYEWLHLQMAEIEAEQARIEQLLLGYAVTPQGDTLFEAMQSNQKLLGEVT